MSGEITKRAAIAALGGAVAASVVDPPADAYLCGYLRGATDYPAPYRPPPPQQIALDAYERARLMRHSAVHNMDMNILALKSVSPANKIRMQVELELARESFLTKLRKLAQESWKL